MNSGTYLVVVLSLLFIGWFGIGFWYNLRKKSKILRRVVKVLSGDLRDNIKYVSLSSTGFILWTSTTNMKLGLKLFLGKREFPIMWIMDWVRGRGDRLEVYVETEGFRECSRATFYNLESYWGRLYSKRVVGEKFRTEGKWTFRGEDRVLNLLKRYSYILASKKEGGKCYYTIVCRPEFADIIVKVLLEELSSTDT